MIRNQRLLSTIFRRAAWLALLLSVATSSGCAALSLFSTTHEHHYETSPALERRLEAVEQRLSAIEQKDGASSSRVPVVSGQGAGAASAAIAE